MPNSKGLQQAISVLASAATDAIRVEQLAGKECIVVPIVALLEGVWQSAVSEYPELALASEFGRTPEGWNGRPVTLGHPKREGSYVSAGRPDVFEQEVVGTLFNSKIEDRKLKTEAWIEKDRVATIGEDAQKQIDRLMSGELVEVSTGLFMNLEDTVGVYNGEEFHGIWRDVVPDHLALLAEGILGACSVADGAGAPRLNQMRTMSKGRAAEAPKNFGAEAFQRINTVYKGEFTLRGLKAISSGDTFTALYAALELEDATVDGGYYIVALFPDSFVYLRGWETTYCQRTYKISDTGTVTLGATVTAVRPVTEFVPIDVQIEGGVNMSVQEKVAILLTKKAKAFSETDKAWLESFSEEQLDKILAASEPEAVTSADPAVAAATATQADVIAQGEPAGASEGSEEPETLESFLAKAPGEIREVLNEGIQMQRTAKNDLVTKLRSNKSCEFSEAELKDMSLQQLSRLAKLAKVPNYAGSAGAATPTVNETQDRFMPAPAVFTREQK